MINRPIAFVADCRSEITKVNEVAFQTLVDAFAQPTLGEKDGHAWLPADIDIGPRKDDRVRSISFVNLDVEADAEAVKDDKGEALRDQHGDIIKRVTGLEPPSVGDMMAELTSRGWRCLLHTTYSYGGAILPEGVEHPRYRLIFDLSQPLQPTELKIFVHYVADLLGLSGCFDSKCSDASRLFYTPRCPTEARMKLYRCVVSEGAPLDVDALLADARLIEALNPSPERVKSTPENGSVIDAFNAKFEASEILEEHGYLPKGRNRWLYSDSTTGDAGVRLLPDQGSGKHIYSSHGGDPLNDGYAHDVFDCYRILKHDGDMGAAVKAVAELFGMTLNSDHNIQKDRKSASASRNGGAGCDVSMICARDLKPEPIDWLWNGYLAAGKMHIFGGAPGTGKTTVSMGLAATVSMGGRWPDGSQADVGNVVIWSGEDDPADTLVPRLILSGADLSRIYFIGDVREGKERRSFDPARDMEPLRKKLEEIGNVKLLIVDPIVSAVTGDSHKNTEVRRALQPLVDLAASMRCALLGITHFSKGTKGANPVERITGSLAFGALARVVLVVAKQHNAESEAGWVFCRAKSNIGPDDGGFEYDLHQDELQDHPGVSASCVMWGNPVEGAARDLLAQADETESQEDGSKQSDKVQFLADLLAAGPMAAKDVIQQGQQAGYSERSLQRAAKELNVDRRKIGMQEGWEWELPANSGNTP